jgi:predicted nucleic-acid-binding protein
MRAVDTKLLVRLVTGDDPKQTTAAEAFIQPGAWVSQIVLVEAVSVLKSAYNLEPVEIARALEMLLAHNRLAIEGPETVTAALERYRKKPRVGFSDCLVLELARKAGHLPLGTFDRALGGLEGAERL